MLLAIANNPHTERKEQVIGKRLKESRDQLERDIQGSVRYNVDMKHELGRLRHALAGSKMVGVK